MTGLLGELGIEEDAVFYVYTYTYETVLASLAPFSLSKIRSCQAPSHHYVL